MIKDPQHKTAVKFENSAILGSNVESENYLQSCYKCDFASKSKKGFHDHIAKHHDESNFPCDFCGQNFSSEKGLGSHIRQKHKGQKPGHVFCNVCDNQITRTEIYSHFSRQHHDLVQEGIETPKSNLISMSVETKVFSKSKISIPQLHDEQWDPDDSAKDELPHLRRLLASVLLWCLPLNSHLSIIGGVFQPSYL